MRNASRPVLFLAVFGPLFSLGTLAPRGSASCSNYNTEHPDYMVDGNVNTWYTSGYQKTFNCVLDIGTVYWITSTNIKYKGGSVPPNSGGGVQSRTCQTYIIELSEDNSNWHVPSGWSRSGQTQLRDDDWLETTATRARYVRWTCNALNSVDVKVKEWSMYYTTPTKAPTKAPTKYPTKHPTNVNISFLDAFTWIH